MQTIKGVMAVGLPINGDKPVTCAKCLAWLEKQAGKQA